MATGGCLLQAFWVPIHIVSLAAAAAHVDDAVVDVEPRLDLHLRRLPL